MTALVTPYDGWVGAIDASFDRVPAARLPALYKSGVRMLAGYAGPGSSGKHLTRAELDAWAACGSDVGVLPLAEGTGRELADAVPATLRSLAASARSAWRALGLPDRVPICHAVDVNVAAQPGAVLTSVKIIAAADRTPALYIEQDAGEWLVSPGLIAGYGTPAAYSWDASGKLVTPATAKAACFWTQERNGVNVDGGVVDVGHVRAGSPCVWWLHTPSSPAPSAPITSSGEVDMARLPQIREGATGQAVRNAQGLLVARGKNLAVDGVFGPDTDVATRAFQRAEGIAVDGVVGPVTWSHLLGIA